MVKYKQLTFLLLLVFMMSFGSVSAANSQGFEWGVEINDRFDYTLSYVQDVATDPSGTWDIYVKILDLPTIPDTVTSLLQISAQSSATPFYFANGTLISGMIPWNCLAIGNWSLVTEISGYVNTGNPILIDTATEWGYSGEVNFGGGKTTAEIRFSKTDGVMNLYETTITNAEMVVTNSLTIVRDGYGGILGLDPTTLLIIGGAVVGLVVVIIVIKRR